jgi:cobalt/nickel transport system permease protein
VSEGLLTVLVVRLLTRVSPAELARLGVRPVGQEA